MRESAQLRSVQKIQIENKKRREIALKSPTINQKPTSPHLQPPAKPAASEKRIMIAMPRKKLNEAVMLMKRVSDRKSGLTGLVSKISSSPRFTRSEKFQKLR